MTYSKLNNIMGWAVFAIAFITYMITIEPTVSLWDCGEYITTASKLEIGHPPGAPTFMMIGAIFASFAGPESKAFMINTMSALSSAFTILFLFWTITRLIRKMIDKNLKEYTKADTAIVMISGIIGSLAYTWSDSFWFSAVEGEVYAMASMFIAAVFWLILKWEFVAHIKGNERYIIAIFLLIGLSIGVHLLSILAIPSIAYIYSFKKYPNSNIKNFIITGVVGIAILMFINNLFVPYTVSMFGAAERTFTNSLGLPFNSGTFFLILLFVALIAFGVYFTKKKKEIAFYTGILSFAMLVLGFACYAMILIRSNSNPPLDENNPENMQQLGSYLAREQYGYTPLFSGGQWNAPLIGIMQKQYNERADIRKNFSAIEKNGTKWFKAFTLNHNGKEISFISEYDAQQYITENNIPNNDLKSKYVKLNSDNYYRIIHKDFKTFFPRMYFNDAQKVRGYKYWSGYRDDQKEGKLVTTQNSLGVHQGKPQRLPTMGQNLRFFVNYQLGWMYWRYFMWNFTGKQTDIQGHGGADGKAPQLEGNWVSGINWIDSQRLGNQDELPQRITLNKGNNNFYFIPLILGLIGMFFHAFKARKDAWAIFLLFLFTGIAIMVFLNQKPFEPRERDYSVVGSFYAFAMWIGIGVYGLYDMAKNLSMKGFIKIATTTLGGIILFAFAETVSSSNYSVTSSLLFMSVVALAFIGLLVVLRNTIKSNLSKVTLISILTFSIPLIMLAKGWDDHNRAGRYFARQLAKNYLDGCGKEGNNAILFCFGDNDTFPLWYLQEVEGHRKDIRTMNWALLGSDWHIDQLHRKLYSSDAPPTGLTERFYRSGSNDRIGINASNKERVHARKIIEEIRSGKDASNYSKVYIDVNKENALKAGLITEKDLPFLVNRIEFDLSKDVFKPSLALLDLLAYYDWSYPICFTSGGDPSGGSIRGLSRYLYRNGLTSILLPLQGAKKVREDSYDLLVNADWGGLNDGAYPDYYVMRSVMSARISYLVTAGQYIGDARKLEAQRDRLLNDTNTNDSASKPVINQEEIDNLLNKGKALLEKYFEEIPFDNVRADDINTGDFIIDLVALYYEVDKEKALPIATKIRDYYVSDIHYFNSLDANFFDKSVRNYVDAYRKLNQLTTKIGAAIEDEQVNNAIKEKTRKSIYDYLNNIRQDYLNTNDNNLKRQYLTNAVTLVNSLNNASVFPQKYANDLFKETPFESKGAIESGGDPRWQKFIQSGL